MAVGQAGFHGHSSLALGRWPVGPAGSFACRAAATRCSRDHVATVRELAAPGLRGESCGPSKAPRTEAVATCPSAAGTAGGRTGHARPGGRCQAALSWVPSWAQGRGEEGRGGRCLLRYPQAADCVPQEGLPPDLWSLWTTDSHFVLCRVGPCLRAVGGPGSRPPVGCGCQWGSLREEEGQMGLMVLEQGSSRVGSSRSLSSLPRPACSPWLPTSLPACSSCPCMWPAPACAPCGLLGAPPLSQLLFRAW